MDIDHLKTAFRKLLTYAYYDKSDMVLRYNMASFARRIADQAVENKVFAQILDVVVGNNPPALKKWLDMIYIVCLPKKLKQKKEGQDEHLITNIPSQDAITERLMVKARSTNLMTIKL